jgi:hypothetical protein
MGCQRSGKSLPIVAGGGSDNAHREIAIRVLNFTGVSNPGHTELRSYLVRQRFREFDFESGKTASIGEVRIRKCGWVGAKA